MRGVFDEREAERERRKRGREKRDREDGAEQKRDREVTLGSFTLLAIFFVLVMLCGLSFGLGYVVGRREPGAKSTVLEPTPIAAQGEGIKGKAAGVTGSRSAGTASDEPAASQGAGAADSQGDAGLASKTETQAPTQSESSDLKAKPSQAATSELSRATLGQPTQVQPPPLKSGQTTVETVAKKSQEAPPDGLMVRVATLAHQDDADVLVEALRRRGYAVGTHRDAVDGMIHVRVGPFASRDAANQWRQKLLNDGYNAVVETQ
jgi:cell division septation protein DedD